MSHTIGSLSLATIRTLSIDAIEKANSGQPFDADGGCAYCIYAMVEIYEY